MRDSQPNRKGPGATQISFGNEKEISVNLEVVTFLRLPEVKAVTGLSKTSLYTLNREKKFSCSYPGRTTRSCMGQVRSQAMGRKSCSRISDCCLSSGRKALAAG